MKVLHVIGPMRTGGAQTQLLGLVRAAHGRYWDATICSTAPGAMAPAFRELGVPMVELRRVGSPGVLRMLAVRRLVGRGAFDVVHGNLWQANAYARLAVAGRRRRPAVVIVEHNVESHRSRAKRLIDRFLDHWTDVHIALTDAMADFVTSVHHVAPHELVRIPNAIDRSLFYPGDPPRNEKLRIGSIGRLDVEKGFDVLIEATRHLVTRRDVEVLIAGTGPLEHQLRAAAAGLPVRFVGALTPGQEVASFLRSLDVFVLPSRSREARPVAVLEALGTGVPVVVSDLPGMAETIAGGGVLVPKDNPSNLAEGVLAAAEDAHARERAISAAQSIPEFDDLASQYRSAFLLALERASALR